VAETDNMPPIFCGLGRKVPGRGSSQTSKKLQNATSV